MTRRAPQRLVFVAMWLLVFAPWIAYAAPIADGACVPNRAPNPLHIHDGWYRDPPGATVYGVEAQDLEEYDPYIYPNGFSSAWVMLSTNEVHMQIGWAKLNGQIFGRKVFIQYIFQDDLITHYYSPKSVGSLTDYRAEYTGTYLWLTTAV